MGLLKIIRKHNAKHHEIRILLLGLDNAGKTTFLKQLKNEDVYAVEPTLGFNIDSITINGLRCNIWDVGGQRNIRPYWRNYFEKTDLLIWVIDSTDIDRLNDCREELLNVLQENRLSGTSLFIFANKQDLCTAISIEEISEILKFDEIVDRNWSISGGSALLGDGVNSAMEWVTREIRRKLYL